MKVIFLDVDGVLHPMTPSCVPIGCPMREIVARAEDEAVNSTQPDFVYHPVTGEFDPDNMANLATVIKVTGASIVLSSTWRESDYSTATVARKLEEYGLPAIIGCTPLHDFDPARPQARRGAECAQWLLTQSDPIEAFVMIDDGEFTLGSAPLDANHFVRTDMAVGLTQSDAERAIELLQKPPISEPLAKYLSASMVLHTGRPAATSEKET